MSIKICLQETRLFYLFSYNFGGPFLDGNLISKKQFFFFLIFFLRILNLEI